MRGKTTGSQTDILRLSANENLFGPSPKVLETISSKAPLPQFYPEYYPQSLKKKISDLNQIPIDQIVIGAGSVEIIDMLIRTYCKLDESILIMDYSFVAYAQLAAMHKRKCLIAPLSNFTCDIENLIALIEKDTKLIFIANPNNPTGTLLTHNQLVEFLNKIPADIMVVIDEAYAEYVTDPAYPATLQLLPKYPNLVILHSFSKIYGLAGLRVGYAFAGTNIIENLQSHKVPFTVNSLGIRGAIAALEDQDYIKECAAINARERKFLHKEISQLGYYTIPSQGNFLFLFFEDENKKNELHKWLLKKNIQICNLVQFGQPKSLRLSTFHHEASLRVVEGFASFPGR